MMNRRNRLPRASSVQVCSLLSLLLSLRPAAAGPPPVDPSQPITLEQAIEIALRNHGSIQAAEQGVLASQQRVTQARAGIRPLFTGEVGYSGSGTTDLGGLFGASQAGESARFDQGLQPLLGLRYTLWDGGVTRLEVRQARTGVVGAQAQLATTRNNLEFSVAVAFLQQLRAQRLLELRQAQVELAEAQLALVDERIRVGSEAPRNRALPLAELRNTQVEAIAAENALRVAANALRNAMGLPVGEPLRLVEPALDTNAVPAALQTLVEQAQRLRPEVIQAEATRAIAEANVRLARLRTQPLVSGVFGLNMHPNRDDRHGDYTVGAVVSMPLWDAGVSKAREREARADLESANARLEQLRKDIAAEVEEAYLNLINARQRLDASTLAVEAARESLEAANARYAVGEAQTVELTTAQIQFFQANNSAIQALYDVFLALAQLERAIGK